jgi:DNA-binding PadR family transcriptional regulator
VVESLEKRRLILPKETEREGRLPERTVYVVTDSGRIEAHDWLSDLLCTPAKEYPAFTAALSFLPALPPDDVVDLLEERALRLEVELAQHQAVRELVEKHELPRLFWVEEEFRVLLRQAELDYARRLAQDIRSGALGGVDWWRGIHDAGDEAIWPPPTEDE